MRSEPGSHNSQEKPKPSEFTHVSEIIPAVLQAIADQAEQYQYSEDRGYRRAA